MIYSTIFFLLYLGAPHCSTTGATYSHEWNHLNLTDVRSKLKEVHLVNAKCLGGKKCTWIVVAKSKDEKALPVIFAICISMKKWIHLDSQDHTLPLESRRTNSDRFLCFLFVSKIH